MDGFEICTPQKEDFYLPQDSKISANKLSLLKLCHIGFDGKAHDGRLVCNKAVSCDLLEIFKELFNAGYPIEKITPAIAYGGDDNKIMADNNSSCFNYRCVANTDNLSMHALGRAVDINPLYNPYIQNGVVMPENAAEFADRSKDFPHKITHDDICYKIFIKHGWKWGGDWQTDKDYQHFYKPNNSLFRRIVRVIR